MEHAYCGAWILASAFFMSFLLINFVGDELMQGQNFDPSTGRLAVTEMQKNFDLSTVQLSR